VDYHKMRRALIDALVWIEYLQKAFDNQHYDYLGADADRKYLENEVVPKLKTERDTLLTALDDWYRDSECGCVHEWEGCPRCRACVVLNEVQGETI
jgi:hypothetical protein